MSGASIASASERIELLPHSRLLYDATIAPCPSFLPTFPAIHVEVGNGTTRLQPLDFQTPTGNTSLFRTCVYMIGGAHAEVPMSSSVIDVRNIVKLHAHPAVLVLFQDAHGDVVHANSWAVNWLGSTHDKQLCNNALDPTVVSHRGTVYSFGGVSSLPAPDKTSYVNDISGVSNHVCALSTEDFSWKIVAELPYSTAGAMSMLSKQT